MYISKIHIRNFRIFDDIGITAYFKKGVNAIISENNCGKTAIVDAIRIAFSTVPYKKDIYFNLSDFHVRNDGKRSDEAFISVYFDEITADFFEIWNPEDTSKGEFHIRYYTVKTPEGKEKVRYSIWGGPVEGNPVSAEIFEAIQLVFLGALRDAETEMRPARSSKLASLFGTATNTDEAKAEIIDVFRRANGEILTKEPLIRVGKIVNENLSTIEQDVLKQHVELGLVEPRFDAIAAALRAWIKPRWFYLEKSTPNYQMLRDAYTKEEWEKNSTEDENGTFLDVWALKQLHKAISPEASTVLENISNSSFELFQNGLGYNNLLFMSTVLGDMAIERGGVYQHLLLIEEPEAHLHPQLQELVHTFLSDTNQGDANIQIIFTSHSPTLASKVDIGNINLIYENAHKKYCLPFSEANLTDANKEYLQKYLDVTKSQMFFAKGIIFVEGISEAILLPEIAKILDRPLEKYAVELVNVDSVAFSPFVNLFSSQNVQTCFSKVAIVTDDDRCTKKSETNYINKDFDYDDVNSDISGKLLSGTPSERCNELETLCRAVGINVFKATKTLEYALCCDENNIEYFIEAIKSEYSQLGPALEQKVNSLHDMNEKAACVWLFIRAREKCKGAIAQYISQIIKKQCEMRKRGENIEKEFVIPDYLKEAVYCVTER